MADRIELATVTKEQMQALIQLGYPNPEPATQEEAAKFFREHFNIKINVNSSTKNMRGQWKDWHCSVNNICVIDHRDGLDHYEDAMRVAVTRAIIEAQKFGRHGK